VKSPLKYDYVKPLKAERPALPIIINGGFTDLSSVAGATRLGLGRRTNAGPRGVPQSEFAGGRWNVR